LHYGKISTVLLYIAFIPLFIAWMLKAGKEWGPVAGMLTVTCAPTSFIFGVLGIILDKWKLLAIFTTILSGIPTYFVVYHLVMTWRNF
jgi:hypothetical protein